MDFRIQSKSTGIPSSLTNNSNHNNHHHHQAIHNSSPKTDSSPSYPEERDPRKNHHLLEDSSFTPSPTADHPHPNHHNHQQRSRSDPDRTDPTHLPTAADQPPPPQTTLPSIRYRECQKNHAAHLGSHVVDGCGEFMPNGEDGTPESLRCAACDCHRNFHRKEVDGRNGGASINLNAYKPINAAISKPLNVITTMAAAAASNAAAASVQFPSPLQQSPMSAINHHHRMVSHHHVPTMMAFGGAGSGGGAESSSEDLNLYRPEEYAAGGSNSKKRYRTKFTQDQKDRMMGFAQKIGWRIQKQDDIEVQQFCAEVGVKRKVFKVWMHNNKQAMKRKEN